MVMHFQLQEKDVFWLNDVSLDTTEVQISSSEICCEPDGLRLNQLQLKMSLPTVTLAEESPIRSVINSQTAINVFVFLPFLVSRQVKLEIKSKRGYAAERKIESEGRR